MKAYTEHREYLPARMDYLPHHVEGQYTATGYGRRIPTRYKVEYNGRWWRVYIAIYSNIGTAYIGDLNGDHVIIRDIMTDDQADG